LEVGKFSKLNLWWKAYPAGYHKWMVVTLFSEELAQVRLKSWSAKRAPRTKGAIGRVAMGQLRLPLTNTYHGWMLACCTQEDSASTVSLRV
jgi:hypothetical protein